MVEAGCSIECNLIRCKAGDMILWDGRTIHCNSRALDYSDADSAESVVPNSVDIIRACAYICMVPRVLASDEVIHLRKEAFIHNESTNHCKFYFLVICSSYFSLL